MIRIYSNKRWCNGRRYGKLTRWHSSRLWKRRNDDDYQSLLKFHHHRDYISSAFSSLSCGGGGGSCGFPGVCTAEPMLQRRRTRDGGRRIAVGHDDVVAALTTMQRHEHEEQTWLSSWVGGCTTTTHNMRNESLNSIDGRCTTPCATTSSTTYSSCLPPPQITTMTIHNTNYTSGTTTSTTRRRTNLRRRINFDIKAQKKKNNNNDKYNILTSCSLTAPLSAEAAATTTTLSTTAFSSMYKSTSSMIDSRAQPLQIMSMRRTHSFSAPLLLVHSQLQHRPQHHSQQQQQTRAFSSTQDSSSNKKEERLRCEVLAMGENWTGAFGTGQLDQAIRGHDDEVDHVPAPFSVFEGDLAAHRGTSFMDYDDNMDDEPNTGQGTRNRSMTPTHGDLPSVSAGWGHSAICAGDQLLLAGQPHDWFKLLRYKRLPSFLARLATQFEGIPKTTFGQALSSLMRQQTDNEKLEKSLLPVPAPENVPMEIQKVDATRQQWHLAEYFSFMNQWTDVPLPEPPLKVQCSAGLSAVLGVSGRLYSFGQNHWGQCGTGIITCSNLWAPEYPVVKSIADDVVDDFHLRKIKQLGDGGFDNTNLPEVRPETDYDNIEEQPFDVLFLRDFALGLQHGIGLDAAGRVYCWGKAKNGQLGQFRIWDDSCAALRVAQYMTLPVDFATATPVKPTYHTLEPVEQVAAGMLHCAALSTDNHVYVWGKNILPPLPKQRYWGRKASDCKVPFQIPRRTLPDRPIVQIACGSHHTAMLFDDGSVYAVGISTDTKLPIGCDSSRPPVQLIPPGVVTTSEGGGLVRYFAAHMDRTTIIDPTGRDLFHAQLWENPDLQRQAMFTPTWVDSLFKEQPHARIEQVHRSWVHSLIVTTTPISESSSSSSPPPSNDREASV